MRRSATITSTRRTGGPRSRVLSRPLVLDPENPEVYWGMGEAQRHLGKFAEAKASYEKLVEYDPDSQARQGSQEAAEGPASWRTRQRRQRSSRDTGTSAQYEVPHVSLLRHGSQRIRIPPSAVSRDDLLAPERAHDSADTKKCAQRKLEQTEAVIASPPGRSESRRGR